MRRLEFEFSALPWNIIFAVDALQRLPDELDKLGLSKALVLTTPNQKGEGRGVIDLLQHRAVGLFDQAQPRI